MNKRLNTFRKCRPVVCQETGPLKFNSVSSEIIHTGCTVPVTIQCCQHPNNSFRNGLLITSEKYIHVIVWQWTSNYSTKHISAIFNYSLGNKSSSNTITYCLRSDINSLSVHSVSITMLPKGTFWLKIQNVMKKDKKMLITDRSNMVFITIIYIYNILQHLYTSLIIILSVTLHWVHELAYESNRRNLHFCCQ